MKNLILLREQKGLRQEDMAKMLGISRQAYCTYENDRHQAGYEILIKLADFFEVSIDYLLERTSMECALMASKAPEYEKIIETQPPNRKERLIEIIKILSEMSDTQLENTLGFFQAANAYNQTKKNIASK